ncbi:MAG TPA: hypothetical protein VGG75_38410 [Trebonia sp.]|jgi:hypothetical protein
MTIAAVPSGGALGSATAKTFTLTPSTVGDFILLWVTAETVADYAVSISSSNISWVVTPLVAHHAFTNNLVVQSVFIGEVTSTSGATQTIVTAAGSPTLRIAWQEFSTTAGYASITLNVSGTTDTLSSGTMPPVTTTVTGCTYAGYVYDNGSGVIGTTSGYKYQLDTNSNQYAYSTTPLGISTYTPNIGDANGTSGIAVAVYEAGVTASAGLAHGTGAALQPQAGSVGLPAGTGTAQPPTAQVTALAGLAHGAGTAQQPQFGIANPPAATGTGTAQQPAAQVTALAGLAHAAGTSFQVPAPAGLAHGTGTAQQPSKLVEPSAGLAAGAGNVFQPTPRILRNPQNLGAVVTPLGPNATAELPVTGGTLTLADLGATFALANLGASLTGWTMQTATLNILEFNDVTINLAITNNGSAYNLASATLNMLFKSAAGTPDADALLFSSAGGSPAITITNSAGGLATVQIPNDDLDTEAYNFYRVDVVVGGFQNTCISGSVTWTSL